MSVEIRQVTEDELEQAEFIIAYSFNGPDRNNLSQAVERAKGFYRPEWSLASFEDGEMTAFVRTIPFAIRINGRGLSFGAVGPVVSLPQHRRKGHVGQILRQSLANMRERGQVLSGLHTPHPSLYRRYGWEIASVQRVYTFAPKDIELMAQPSERGRARMLKPDDWQYVDRVYRQHSAERNGAIHRGEIWWRNAIFSAPWGGPYVWDVVVWEDATGEPQGYAVYGQSTQPDAERPPADEGMPQFLVREIVALTTDAYLNLIQYILRHDLPRQITWNAPPYDPFLSLVSDTRRVGVREDYDLMLRLSDVEGALALRPPAYPGHDVALTLQVTDDSAPWNTGTYRIELRDGETAVERTTDEPDMSLSAATLAPVYNGYLPPRGGALAGLISARDDDAVDRAQTFFATTHAPYCADGF